MFDFLEKFTISGFEPGDFTMGVVHKTAIVIMLLGIFLLSYT